MKALVIGSTGLVGSNLVKELLKKGYSVAGTSRNAKHSFLNAKLYTHFQVDITDQNDFNKLPSKFDLIFNTSGYVPRSKTVEESTKCMLVNAIGVQNILNFMVHNNIKRLIHSSSVTVYGIPDKLIVTEESPLKPILAYGISKVAAENFCIMYERLFGLSITMLRYSPIYGVGLNQRTAFTIFVEKAVNNEIITLFQKGERFQDYIYVADVVQANLQALEKNMTGPFNIASGEISSMKTLAESIVRIFKSNSKFQFDGSQEEEFSIGIDITKAKRLLTFTPKYSLVKGLKAYKQSIES